MPAHVLNPRPSPAIVRDRLERFARQLGADVGAAIADLGPLLDTACAADRSRSLVPGRAPIEVSYAQAAPLAVRIDFEPTTPDATAFVARAVAQTFGADAECAFAAACVRDAHRCVAGGGDPDGAAGGAGGLPRGEHARPAFGPFVGVVADGEGTCEVKLYRARTERSAAVALVEDHVRVVAHMASLAWRRDGLAERSYLRCPAGLVLSELGALAHALGLGAHAAPLQHAIFAIAGAAVLGPDAAVLGLRPRGGGWELKVDVFPTGDAARRVAIVEALLASGADGLAERRRFAAWRRCLGPAELGTLGLTAASDRPLALNAYYYPAWSAAT